MVKKNKKDIDKKYIVYRNIALVLSSILIIINGIWLSRIVTKGEKITITHTATVGISGEALGKDEVKDYMVKKGSKIEYNLLGEKMVFTIEKIENNKMEISSTIELYDNSKQKMDTHFELNKGENIVLSHLVPDASSSFVIEWQ